MSVDAGGAAGTLLVTGGDVVTMNERREVLVGGAVAFLIAGSGTGPTATIRECRIDADGSLTAAGKVDGGDGSAKVHVEFRNSDGNDVVDSGSTDASSSGTWEVTGSASDDVQKVTCVVTRVGS